MIDTDNNIDSDQDGGVRLAIRSIITRMMDRVMDRVLYTDPFVKESHRTAKPLYAALVPDEIFKGSHFERRFVTPFGRVWEELAKVVAQVNHGDCRQGYEVTGLVGEESLRRIQEVLNRLEHGTTKDRARPDWKTELIYIKQGGGSPLPVSVTSDIFIHNTNTNQRYAFELKAPLPNSDQTKVSKEKMFKLLSMTPSKIDHAYFALAYNPYGKRKDYAWTFPSRWFNMHEDESVLIGDEFWNLIGGDGTYSIFIDEINKLGKEYRERIYREFLEIEPPANVTAEILR